MSDLNSYLAAVRDRLAKATPGPWDCIEHTSFIVGGPHRIHIGSANKPYDIDFIAHTPADIARFLALVEVVQELVKAGNTLEASYDKPERFMAISNARHDWKEALIHWHTTVAEVLNA